MITRHRLAALVTCTLLCFAGRAFADAPEVGVQARSSRADRPWSIGVGAMTTGLGLPIFGVEAEYQLTDRLALGAGLGSALLVGVASANARYFVAAEPTSGLYLELAGHALGGLVSGPGASAELGYQYRSRAGFLLEASAGLWVLHLDGDCGCGPPPMVVRESPWHASPSGSLRLGYAF
jgi:hypothetical protein